ncbi:MAG TPA: hydroxyisourate hydrolase [Acidobacteriaceae bacterium]|nr:hydroxyisourate hydrolase [Acidobacteriaceae bacterium]
MSGISTHVLDLARGKPAAGVRVRLSREDDGAWIEVAAQITDGDGRVKSFLGEGATLVGGRYRLRFETGDYFGGLGVSWFHPYIEIAFDVANAADRYHVPLLLAPFGYSTYRGS